MTSEVLAGSAGVLLSLGFAYLPGLRTRYRRLDGVQKRLLMLGLLLVVSLATLGLSCLGWAEALNIPPVGCGAAGALELARLFALAVIANQSAFSISPGAKART